MSVTACVFADIEDLPPAVQEKLFDEVLDRDVQKGIQDASMSTSYYTFARPPSDLRQSALHLLIHPVAALIIGFSPTHLIHKAP